MMMMNGGINGVDKHTLLLLKFNENGPKDYSMYNHTITNNGCVFTYPSVDGKGRSVSKSSRNCYLKPDTDFVTQITNNGTYTIECYVNIPSNLDMFILTKDASGDVDGWSFCYESYGVNLRLSRYILDIRCEARSIVEAGWVHVCATKNNDVASFYCNGNLVKTKTLSNDYAPNYECLIFGRTTNNGSNSYSPAIRMDCLRISDVCRYNGNFTPVYFQP